MGFVYISWEARKRSTGMSNSCVLKHCKNFILTGNTIRVCYWCHAICQLLKVEVPSFSPPEAQGWGEAPRQQSHTQTSWHSSSSALAAAASLQPLPSSWSRSLHGGESWERPARHSGGWGFALPQHCCLHGSSEHLHCSLPATGVIPGAGKKAAGLKEEWSCLQSPCFLFSVCQHSLVFPLIVCPA